MMKLISIILLIVALILESTLTTVPLIFLVLLCITVVFRENFVFVLAFIFGLLLDLMLFKVLGISSLFFVVSVFLALLYQRKFEIATNYFILGFSFIGSLGYLFILGYNNSIFLQAIISSLTGLLLFIVFKRILKIDLNTSKNL